MKIKLDLTGFQKFYSIFKDLSQGKDITKEMWDELFKTAGYKSLIEKEFKREFFIENFELAFNPNKKEELEEKITDTKEGRFLQYFVQAKTQMEEYKKAIDSIKDEWDRIEDSIFTRASSLLPLREWESKPMISIILFDRDVRSYNTIVIDPFFTINLEAFVSLTAHKLHSFLRNEILCFEMEKVEDVDKDLIWMLNQIHSEGVADHIDKGFFVYSKYSTFFHEKYVIKYKENVQNSPEIIEEINSLFEKEDNKIGSALKEFVPLSGHPLGYYMTNIIMKNLQIDLLVKNVGNPFYFFKLFNEAVKKDRKEISSFSEKTIDIIEKLEKKYVKLE